MAKGILIAAMNIANAAEDEFHDWYDTEHLPERERVAGFRLCQRWIGADDRKISIATSSFFDTLSTTTRARLPNSRGDACEAQWTIA